MSAFLSKQKHLAWRYMDEIQFARHPERYYEVAAIHMVAWYLGEY